MNSEEFDLDLFIIANGFYPILRHFATAGGYIASELASNPIHASIRAKLKSPLNELRFDYMLNPRIDEILSRKNEVNYRYGVEFDRNSYLVDFIEYAKCGCFSFDRTYINEPNNHFYHLVAYPVVNEKYLSVIRMISNSIYRKVGFVMNNNEIEVLVRETFGNPIDFKSVFL